MVALLLKVAPVLLIFMLGIILKKVRMFTEDNADTFLKLVFYVSLPASILVSITNIPLTLNLIFIPLSAVGIIAVSYVVARITGAWFKLPRTGFGVFLVGSMIINTALTFPFFLAVYGEQGFAKAALFDFGNGLMALTLAYFVAVKYGSENGETSTVIKKFLSSTPLWALFIAMTLNVTGVALPEVVTEILRSLGSTLIPLYMISLGIRFNLRVVNLKALVSVITIRMLMGLLLGFIFVSLFRLEGLNRVAVLVCSSAPVGLTTLTFATMEKLDTEFAASLVSVSLMIGIIVMPLLMLVLPH